VREQFFTLTTLLPFSQRIRSPIREEGYKFHLGERRRQRNERRDASATRAKENTFLEKKDGFPDKEKAEGESKRSELATAQ